ncbi:hypothetical protein [Conchiformibius steedae]|uniref:hypothetical protein n=1 Tax=Conchiformibius steedae TaxID=153493 RepID=UPI001C7102B1|nr:hypothetical protein [Conchiformibius steedae]
MGLNDGWWWLQKGKFQQKVVVKNFVVGRAFVGAAYYYYLYLNTLNTLGGLKAFIHAASSDLRCTKIQKRCTKIQKRCTKVQNKWLFVYFCNHH